MRCPPGGPASDSSGETVWWARTLACRGGRHSCLSVGQAFLPVGGAGILACRWGRHSCLSCVREWGHSCPPNARFCAAQQLSVGSGGKNAPTPRPMTDKNACPTDKECSHSPT